MKKTAYEFNQNGVCINPTIVLVATKKEYFGEVTVFQAPSGKWGYSRRIRIRFGDMAVSSSPPWISDAPYNTMEEARRVGIEKYSHYLAYRLECAKAWNRRVAAGDSMGEEGNGQMSLF